MKVTIGKAELLSEAQQCLLAVERKSSIPILYNFLLQAKADTLTITGTDLDISLVHVMSAKVIAEGEITVPARKLIDILKQLKTVDAKDVTINNLGNNWVGVTCGPLFVKIAGMESKSYPSLSDLPTTPTISVPSDVLSGLIARTTHAIAREESRYTLNAALLVIKSDTIRMATTDGHRLALVTHAGAFAVSGEMRVLVHSRALDVLRHHLAGKQPLEIVCDDATIFIRSANWVMRSRKATGQFPNYEAVIPKDIRNEAIVVATDLKATVSRVAMFADERSRAIRFSFTPEKGLVVYASSTELGEASERIPVVYNGAPVTIGFNAQFVQDVLSTLDKADAVRIKTRDAESAAMFVPFNESAFVSQNIIMPMRI